MNFAIGVSGLRPKVLNRSSGIVEQCPQRKHSTAIRFMPLMRASNGGAATRMRALRSQRAETNFSRRAVKCPLWVISGPSGRQLLSPLYLRSLTTRVFLLDHGCSPNRRTAYAIAEMSLVHFVCVGAHMAECTFIVRSPCAASVCSRNDI